MKPIIAKAQQSQLRKDHPVFRPGDTIRVNVRLKEGEEAKERIQPFEGVVMSRGGETVTKRRRWRQQQSNRPIGILPAPGSRGGLFYLCGFLGAEVHAARAL